MQRAWRRAEVYRTAESFEACPEAATGGSCSCDLASKHSTCLPCVASRAIDLPLPLTSSRAGSSDRTYQGDRRHPGALRLPSYPSAVTSGRVAHQPEAGLPAVPRNGLAIARQDTEAQGEGKAARGSAIGHAAERDLGDGLRA